jgi:hypothetical protein
VVGLTVADNRQFVEGVFGNAVYQRDLSVVQSKIGDVRIQQGDLVAALISYQGSYRIVERLAEANVGDTDCQRHLSVVHIKVGDVQVQLGRPGGGAN